MGGASMQEVWSSTFKHGGLLRALPPPPLSAIVWVVWIFSLVQLIAQVAASYRREELRCDGPALNATGRRGMGKSVINGDPMHNADVAMTLAVGVGLGTAGAMMMTDAEAGIRKYTKSLRTSSGVSPALLKADMLGNQMVLRVLGLYVGCVCLALYSQTAVFLIQCFLSRKKKFLTESVFAMAPASDFAFSRAGLQDLVSLVLSFLNGFAGLSEAYDFLVAIRHVVDEATKHWEVLPEDSREVLTSINKSKVVVLAGMVIICFSLLLTAAKLLAGIFLCADVMWNLTDVFEPSRGCVNLHDVAESLASNK